MERTLNGTKMSKKQKINKERKLKVFKRCKKPSAPMRVSPEMKKLINQIRARYLLEGKNPPSITRITAMIAKKINQEELLKDEIIRF